MAWWEWGGWAQTWRVASSIAGSRFPLSTMSGGKRRKSSQRELKCRATESLADVTATADFILTVVSDDDAMRSIYTGEGDNLLTGAKDKIFINFATLSPRVQEEVSQAAARAGAATIEACMASSITQAREGTLFLILAGKEDAVKKAEALLAALSSARRYVGAAGRAAQVKALVNMVMNINTAGLAEGLGLGDALGLDLEMLREIFAQTGAASRVLETDGADMQTREHACFFSAAHAAKDSGYRGRVSRTGGSTGAAGAGRARTIPALGAGRAGRAG